MNADTDYSDLADTFESLDFENVKVTEDRAYGKRRRIVFWTDVEDKNEGDG